MALAQLRIYLKQMTFSKSACLTHVKMKMNDNSPALNLELNTLHSALEPVRSPINTSSQPVNLIHHNLSGYFFDVILLVVSSHVLVRIVL